MAPQSDNREPEWPPVLSPNVQLDFYYRLQEIRQLLLAESLSEAVRHVQLSTIDSELNNHVPSPALTQLAESGMRGETFFAVPSLLTFRPRLIGYYRLLYGLSQKEFYTGRGFGRFKRMEEANSLSPKAAEDVPAMCTSLAETGRELLTGMAQVSVQTVRELQLLTLGAQFRGSRNTQLGQAATKRVFDLIAGIAEDYLKTRTETTLVLQNSAQRTIAVKFGADPDVAIEDVTGGNVRPVVSIEIKGGTDVSNIHNRVGEAEKSHQKAKGRGFFQFWTILGARISLEVASSESPTTTKFYSLPEIEAAAGEASREFLMDTALALGLPAPSAL